MKIIIVSDRKHAGKQFSVRFLHLGGAVALLLLLCAGFFRGGVYLQSAEDEQDLQLAYEHAYERVTDGLMEELAEHRHSVEQTSRQAQSYVNVLAVRLSHLQAQTLRLEALGSRLVNLAGLDANEFDLEAPVALGGPAGMIDDSSGWIGMDNLIQSLDELALRIRDRTDKLYAIEDLLMGQDVQNRSVPAGNPVVGGWVSSHYGVRTDPFTGQRELHRGIDITGRRNSQVLAIASGVVTWEGHRTGYGNLVEINHGEGYTTLYGHNKSHLVQVGQWVDKGQPIAVMGSTGRSTGAHVHVEVHHEGKPLNPKNYVSVK